MLEKSIEDLQNEPKQHVALIRKVIEKFRNKLEGLQNKEKEYEEDKKRISEKFNKQSNENWIWRALFFVMFICTIIGFAAFACHSKKQLGLLKSGSNNLRKDMKDNIHNITNDKCEICETSC